jgi:hypothetical protein
VPLRPKACAMLRSSPIPRPSRPQPADRRGCTFRITASMPRSGARTKLFLGSTGLIRPFSHWAKGL